MLAAASRGGVKQVLRLHDNGSTRGSPRFHRIGDTRLGEGMGLHLIGDNLIFDAETVAGEPRCGPATWPTASRCNSVPAFLPGRQVGVANTGTRLMFDCLTASTGLETCMTDGTPQEARSFTT